MSARARAQLRRARRALGLRIYRVVAAEAAIEDTLRELGYLAIIEPDQAAVEVALAQLLARVSELVTRDETPQQLVR
jgi:hypothetical protein